MSDVTAGPKYAFIVSRFPKLTETFILRELRGLADRGLDFELFALIHETSAQLQPDAAELDARAHYPSLRSAEPWSALWFWLRRDPRRLATAARIAVSTSRQSREVMLRLPVVFLISLAMARRMERLGIDRVHAHWATYPTLAALIIKQLTDIPYSFTGHAQDIFIERGGLAAKVAGADLVVTCTDHGRDVISGQVTAEDAAKVVLLHHGTDLESFALLPLRQPRTGALRLICVASLEEMKGHRYLLDACRILVDRGIDLELELIGDGPLRAELEAKVEVLGLGSRIRFLGRRSSTEVRARLEWADVFVLASMVMPNGLMDGIPNVLVEALAIGRPSVSTALPGIVELVTDGVEGLLCDPQDANGLAERLQRLHDEPDLAAALVRAGRARVEREHNAEHTLDRLYRLLTELPTGHGPSVD